MKEALIILMGLLPLAVAEDVDSLRITEVIPSTGQVEVTNIGSLEVRLEAGLPFCHRFRYTPEIPAQTVFQPGESKVYDLDFSNPGDSDLWLYRGGSFSNGANIISGLKWGPAEGVGRTNLATESGHWDGSGVAVPTEGQALHLVGKDSTISTSWKLGAADLGRHAFPTEGLTLELTGQAGQLSWRDGQEPFRVQQSEDMETWRNVSGLLGERQFELNGELLDRAYFRIVDDAQLEESASFRLSFTSIWSRDTFDTVPGGDHFSGLIGGTHGEEVSFWAPGSFASEGIKRMAETGSRTTLLAELNAAIAEGTAGEALAGGGLGAAGSSVSLDFVAQREFPLLTITSMIAPSPDWFVGLHGETLLQENGDWVESLSFDLLAYDAGTDSGTSFTSANRVSNPRERIFLIPSSDANFRPKAPAVPGPEPIPLARIVIERTR